MQEPLGSGNVDVKISADINKMLEPLIQSTPKGIKKLFGLLLGKKESEVLRYKMLTAAQTKHDCELILSGKAKYVDGAIQLIPGNSSSTIIDLLEIEQREKISNFASNFMLAIEELRQIPNEHISSQEVDEDFFMRWREGAKLIGQKSLKRIWSTLLSEEIKNPQSISYRTLEVVKNITHKEALIFNSACKYVLNNHFIPCNIACSRMPCDLTLKSLLTLHNAGLLHNPSSNIWHDSTEGTKSSELVNKSYFTNSSGLVFNLNTKKKVNLILGVPLTEEGGQILKICAPEHLTQDEIEYFCGVLKCCSNKTKSISVSNFDIQKRKYNIFFTFS